MMYPKMFESKYHMPICLTIHNECIKSNSLEIPSSHENTQETESPEYKKLYIDFMTRELILTYQQAHRRMNENQELRGNLHCSLLIHEQLMCCILKQVVIILSRILTLSFFSSCLFHIPLSPDSFSALIVLSLEILDTNSGKVLEKSI